MTLFAPLMHSTHPLTSFDVASNICQALLPGALSLPNAGGPVYTIGVFEGKPIRNVQFEQDAEGYVVSPKERSKVPVTRLPVVHQYDRRGSQLKP